MRDGVILTIGTFFQSLKQHYVHIDHKLKSKLQVGRFISSSYKIQEKIICNAVTDLRNTVKKFMATGIAQKSCTT